jgi:Tfp pilus assembly protein PilF
MAPRIPRTARRKQTTPRPRPSTFSPSRWRLSFFAILLLTFAAYVPSLDNGYVHWDDTYYVTGNPVVSNPTVRGLLTTPVAANWHPLTMASLALNWRISAADPTSYHWLNLLLHLANTALVFLFVRRLSRGRFWTTAVTSLFFGIHPLHVESVAWIAGRKDVLYALFYLIALIAYLHYVDARSRAGWGVCLVATLLAIASKPAAVVLPLTLFAIDYFRSRSWSPRLVLEKTPFFALSALGGLITLRMQQSMGALTAPEPWSFIQRAAFAAYGTFVYIGKMFVPVGLSAVYPYPPAGHGLPPVYPAALTALVILLAAALYGFRRNRVVVFGLAFFFINLVLVLQLVTVGTAVLAERYTYIPYIGLFLSLSWWLDKRPVGPDTRRRTGAGRQGGPWNAVLAGYLLLMLPFSLFQTWKRCDVWRDPETFWSDAIDKHPRQIVAAYTNRGNFYRRAGRLEEAHRDYHQALALNPTIPSIWYNQGVVLARMGSVDSALVSLDRALALEPDHARARNDRGALRFRRGDLDGAMADFTRLIELDPRSWNGYTNRALAYSKLGEHAKAVADRRRAIELEPRNPANPVEWGRIGDDLFLMGRMAEARASYDLGIAAARAGGDSAQAERLIAARGRTAGRGRSNRK